MTCPSFDRSVSLQLRLGVPMLALTVALFSVSPSALAAEPAGKPKTPTSPPPTAPPNSASGSLDPATASHCARGEVLVGANCSYSTGMMARRVVEDGQEWSFVGTLTATDNALTSLVAAPFTAGAGPHVIATELLEQLVQQGHAAARLSLMGRVLEVDGVRYVVLTSFRVINS